MRSRDWTSDVCSSDLQKAIDANKLDLGKTIDLAALQAAGLVDKPFDGVKLLAKGTLSAKITIEVTGASKAAVEAVEKAGGKVVVAGAGAADSRSEEHTSELQSLMRISYAVFCLKKKKLHVDR